MLNALKVFIAFTLVVSFSCKRSDYPPKAPVKNVTDTYFGVEVTDPYRYMENIDDTVFLAWMKEYSNYTRNILDGIPVREEILEKINDFDQRLSERVFSLQITENSKYFYLKMRPEDDFGKLYFRDGLSGDEKLLFDPSSYSQSDDADYVISGLYPDKDGEKIAVSVAPNGSESNTLLIINVANGKILNDRIEMMMAGFSWLKGGSSFVYTKYHSDDIFDQNRILDLNIYLHRIGTSQEDDRIIFSSAMNPNLGMEPKQIPVIIYEHHGDQFLLYFLSVERALILFHSEFANFKQKNPFTWKRIAAREDEIQNLYLKGDELYLYTAKGAPGFRILKTSVKETDISNAEVVVPEPETGKISNFSITSDGLYYTLMINGVEEKLFFKSSADNEAEEIELPETAGSIEMMTLSHKQPEIWVSISGWTTNSERYRYDHSKGEFSKERLSTRAEYPEFADLVVEELMVPSHDGVMVPLSLVYQKGIKKDGSAPVLMTGYGAYGISITPKFISSRLLFTLYGGIYAVAHVRGGGELGDAWRLAGNKTTKPNTWKDFIACTEYLHEHNYSSPEHTAIYGGSAGGILIGRSITERPDLFAAAIPMVGAMNTMRIEESPNGPINVPEFGSTADSVECMALLEMDSYLSIKNEVKYPATLVTAGFNDPRVIIWQPAKFAARLLDANASNKPVLFDVDYTSGHGIGDTKSKSFENAADLLAFALWQTGQIDYTP